MNKTSVCLSLLLSFFLLLSVWVRDNNKKAQYKKVTR